MDKLRDTKLRTISDFLFRWCNPKPHYEGVSSMYLADLLLKELEVLNIEDFEKLRAEEEVIDDEKRLAYQYDSDVRQ